MGALIHGRYLLQERIGAGGFGVVWRARDETLHREVALKRIPLAPAEDDGRASREALASARLSHPAIVALYEAYADGDAFYLVSELVRGATLAQLIAADALSDERTLEIGMALTDALDHAHARGVVHRDIKPQNVLVPAGPSAHGAPAKLADFGGARLVGEDALTRAGETLGTLAYMAPEQSEGRDVDEPADIYALALVLYEALTGVNPVRGPTPAATARRIGRPIPALASRRPDLPRALAGALDRALAVEPARRAPLGDLRVALEEAHTEGRLPARASGAGRERRDLVPVSREPAHRADVLAPGADTHADARRADGAAQADRPRGRGVRAPRGLWLGGALALAVWQALDGRAGVALLVLAAAAPLLMLGRRPGGGPLAGALAPLLGLTGLAGAYPALAGQRSRWSERAWLGALGFWWLTLAEPLLHGSAGSRLWLGPPAGLPARGVWEGSLGVAATHVIAPALSFGALLGAMLWALAAASLPWLVRGGGALLDALAAAAWTAALLAATPYLAAPSTRAGAVGHPRGLVLGALVGAGVAIAARALRGPVRGRHP